MGKILRCHRNKSIFARYMLDATAGGALVRADEQLLEFARRVAEEELGIAGVPSLQNTVCFTLKTNTAGFGARCLAAFTGLRASGR